MYACMHAYVHDRIYNIGIVDYINMLLISKSL